jgi:hypothetical protein
MVRIALFLLKGEKMKRFLSLLTLVILCFFALVPQALAAKFGTGNEYSLDEGEVVQDSLYVGAGTVAIRGTIEDDLIVGGGTVVVSGDVLGDVMVGAGTVNISGSVADDVRAAGGLVSVDGEVGGDVVSSGGAVNLGSESTIGGDLVAAAGTVSSAGLVSGRAKISAGNLRISGTINGNVEAVTEEAPRLSSTAKIGGDFVYTSENEAEIREGASVAGKVTHKLPKVRGRRVEPGGLAAFFFALGLIWKIIFLAAMFVAGSVLIALFPKWTKSAADNIPGKPWLSLGWGFLLLIVTPVASILLLITVIGLPLGLIVGALYAAALYLAWIVVGRYAGWQIIRLIRKEGEPSPYWSLLLGLVILALIMLIPILNIFAYFLFVIAGLGAAVMALSDSYREAKAEGRA